VSRRSHRECRLEGEAEHSGGHRNHVAGSHSNLAGGAGRGRTGRRGGGAAAAAAAAPRRLAVARASAGGSSRAAGAGGSGEGGSGLGGGLARAGGGVINRVAIVDDLDALPGAAAVGPDVLGGLLGAAATHEVLDADLLVVGVERAVGEVGEATSPLDGSGGHTLLAGNPRAKLHAHGGLRVAGAALKARGVESADDLAVDDPVQLLARPLERVGVELALGV